MLTHFFDTWTSFYSNHAMLRTTITFVHVGGLMAGGGCAITADLATIEAVREGPIGRTTQLHVLKRTHTIVVSGLCARGQWPVAVCRRRRTVPALPECSG